MILKHLFEFPLRAPPELGSSPAAISPRFGQIAGPPPDDIEGDLPLRHLRGRSYDLVH